MRILIVEGEKDATKALSLELSENGYAVDVTNDSETVLAALLIEDYDLLLLDLDLSDMDGMRVCALAREKSPSTLILILSARGKKEDIVKGLDSGADDYLVKPFHFQELLARIRALFRRDMRTRDPNLRIQDIVLDTVEKKVWKADQKVKLTKKEFGIVEYLIQHPNEVVSQEEILEHVWGELSNVFTNTVRVHIHSLRKKLGDDLETPKYIETVIGFGYRLIDPETDCQDVLDNAAGNFG